MKEKKIKLKIGKEYWVQQRFATLISIEDDEALLQDRFDAYFKCDISYIKEIELVQPPKIKSKIKVNIIESERDWGSKIDEIKEFDSREEAEKYVSKFNESNSKDYAKTGIVPDWYMQAEIVE